MNIKTPQHQRGMAGTTLMFVIVILVFSLWIFFKLFPVYMENWKVGSALENLQEEQNITQKMDGDIRRLFLEYLSDKDVELFDNENIKQHVTIYRMTEEKKVEITVEYEKIEPLMGNISFLLKFENRIEAP
jgi:hypothetical protein